MYSEANGLESAEHSCKWQHSDGPDGGMLVVFSPEATVFYSRWRVFITFLQSGSMGALRDQRIDAALPLSRPVYYGRGKRRISQYSNEPATVINFSRRICTFGWKRLRRYPQATRNGALAPEGSPRECGQNDALPDRFWKKNGRGSQKCKSSGLGFTKYTSKMNPFNAGNIQG